MATRGEEAPTMVRVASVSGPTDRTWRGDILVTVRLSCGHEYRTMDVVAPREGAMRRCRECDRERED